MKENHDAVLASLDVREGANEMAHFCGTRPSLLF